MTLKALKTKYPDQNINDIVSIEMKNEFLSKYNYSPVAWVLNIEHHCCRKEIGGVEDIRKLINDLEKAINFIKDNPIK